MIRDAGAGGSDAGDGGMVNLLWTATFEPGDLSEWSGDGQGGSFLQNATTPAASLDVAHQGRFSGKCAVSPAPGLVSISYVFRHQPSPSEAYYGAWYYLSPAFTVHGYLSLVHFNGSHTGDGNNVYPTWDLNIYPQPSSGVLIAHLYNYETQANVESASPVPVPNGRWVHFEVLMRKATDATGRIAVWQNDVLVLDAEGVVTTENDWMEWEVGAASDDLSPPPGLVYVDDATISLKRLGGS